MALRPDEKRGILAALLDYQRGAGAGALAGMQRREQREDLLEQRAYSEEDQIRRATLGLFGRDMWGAEGEPVPLKERIGLIRSVDDEDIQIPEGITTTPPHRERQFAQESPSLALQRQMNAFKTAEEAVRKRMDAIEKTHGNIDELRRRLTLDSQTGRLSRAARKHLKEKPVLEEERRAYEEYVDLRGEMSTIHGRMQQLVAQHLGYGSSMGTSQSQAVQSEGVGYSDKDLESTTTEWVEAISPDGQRIELAGESIRRALVEGYQIVAKDKLSKEDLDWAITGGYFRY